MSPTRMTLPRRGERGFTLVELLITVVIIAVLTAIAVPAYITVVANAQDSAARQSLASVDSAQNISAVQGAIDGPSSFSSKSELASSGVLALGGRTDVLAADGCWVAQAKSESGKSFYATSNGPIDTDGISVPDTTWCLPAQWLGISRGVLRSNLAANPGAEGNLSTLSTTSAPVATTDSISSEQSRSGTSYKRTTNAAGELTASFRSAGGTFPVAAGERLSWSVWVYSAVPFSAARWCDGSTAAGTPAGFGAGNAGPFPANTWVRVETSLLNPRAETVNISKCGIYGMHVGAGVTMFFDDILIERAAPTGDWFSGSSANTTAFEHQWSGEPGNSSSVRIGELPG